MAPIDAPYARLVRPAGTNALLNAFRVRSGLVSIGPFGKRAPAHKQKAPR